MNHRTAPSILCADLARVGEVVRRGITTGAYGIHGEVRDDQDVSNRTPGPAVTHADLPTRSAA